MKTKDLQKKDFFSKNFEAQFASAILNEEYELVIKKEEKYHKDKNCDADSFGTDDSMQEEDAEKKRPAPVSTKAMHASGHTMEYPREDNVYTMKQSFPFDEIQTKVW